MNVLKAGSVINQPIGQLIIAAASVNELVNITLLTCVNNMTMRGGRDKYIVPLGSMILLVLIVGWAAVKIVPRWLEKHVLPRVPQHLLNAALKKLTLLLAAATLINEAKRKKNAPLKLLPDRTFVATRAREELKTVYFLRHGESQWNEAQANRNPVKMFGKFDHALTAEGLEQADRLARRIARTPSWKEERRAFERCTIIYCSPLTRALPVSYTHLTLPTILLV